jgi:large subunit ribosomal protein L23
MDISIIKKVVVTEKSARANEAGKYTFHVSEDATKSEIKKALRTLYKVDVLSIRTITQQPIRRRYRGQMTLKKAGKKAIVTLKEGQKIDIA